MSKNEIDLPKVTIPADAPEAIDEEAMVTAQRAYALGEATGWDMPVENSVPLCGEALDTWLDRKEDEIKKSRVERGVGYVLKKRECAHGEFSLWVEKTGRNMRSVQRDMKAARLMMELNASNATRVSHLPERKANALLAAPAPVLNDLFESGQLDDIEAMEPKDIAAVIRLNKQLKDETEAREATETQLNEVLEAQRREKRLPPVKAHVLELRQAVVEETEQLRATLHAFQRALDQVALLPEDVDAADMALIVGPLMWGLQGLRAGVSALWDRACQTADGYQVRDFVLPTAALSEQEAELAQHWYFQFVDDAQHRKTRRELDAEHNRRSGGATATRRKARKA